MTTMKYSETKAPRGATHARLTTPAGKKAVVTIKDLETLDGTEGTLVFLKKSGKDFVEVPGAVPPTPAPSTPAATKLASVVTMFPKQEKPPKVEPKVKAKKTKNADTQYPGYLVTEPPKEGERVHKGHFIFEQLTKSGVKLSMILDRTVKKFPKSNPALTLLRIRHNIEALHKAHVKLNFTDEPEFKVEVA